MKDVVIFGAGHIGRQVYNKIGSERVACFADNFPISDSYLELPLIGFDELLERYTANPEMTIIVAAHSYVEEICRKLDENGVINYFVWPYKRTYPRTRAYMYDAQKEYIYSKLFDDYNVGVYKNIAVYSRAYSLPFLFELFEKKNVRIKYIIEHDALCESEFASQCQVVPVADFDEIKNNIDLLILDIDRNASKLHDIVECSKIDFDLADLHRFERFVRVPALEKFKDVHKGERCFIIGNGPSLRTEDLETLHKKNEICFGQNKIYLTFDKTSWRPDYYVATDLYVVGQNAKDIHDKELGCRFIADNIPYFWATEHANNAIKFRSKKYDLFVPNMPAFSSDFSAVGILCATVTYTTIQLAAYMGFDEIYLLGVDKSYSTNSQDSQREQDHFTKDYFRKGELVGVADIKKMTLAYKKAELYSHANGFRIFNATRGGELEEFERVDFDQIVSG